VWFSVATGAAAIEGRVQVSGWLPVSVGVLAVEGQVESDLRAGAIELLRAMRYWGRRVGRLGRAVWNRWIDWTAQAVLFSTVLLLVPVLDRRLLGLWRRRGSWAVLCAISLAIAVYVRLWFDRRVPGVARALLACSLIYGVGAYDLIPDRALPIGLVDDLIALSVCSSCFIRLCPDVVLEEKARLRGVAYSKRTGSPVDLGDDVGVSGSGTQG